MNLKELRAVTTSLQTSQRGTNRLRVERFVAASRTPRSSGLSPHVTAHTTRLHVLLRQRLGAASRL